MSEPTTHSEEAYPAFDRLRVFLVPTDKDIRSASELAGKLAARAYTSERIHALENDTSSWDYCRQAALDLVKGERKWIPIHEDAYWYQMGCVPPALQVNGVTLTGEAYDGPYHLSLSHRRSDDTYWCCHLTRREVGDPVWLFNNLEFSEASMLGVPDEGEDLN